MSETRYFSPSQKAFMFGVPKQRMLMGGWRGGKTTAGINAGLLLSYHFPGNVGFIGRASAQDLTESTMKTFDEFCPPEWIIKSRKIGQAGREVWIRSKDPQKPSRLIFNYIVDRQSGKSHIAGMNLGWFLVDQVEEIQRADWIKLTGRLSLKGFKKHAMGVGNQNGHDWIFEDFFDGGDYVFDRVNHPKVFFKQVLKENRLGIVVLPEENKVSNGGFVEDDFYDDQRKGKDPQFIARYLDSSFDDFNGKIYGDYNLTSVHNIEPFDIPKHWPCYGAIDPGGQAPWGVLKAYCDEDGNIIIVDDAEPCYVANVNPNTVIQWVKQNFDVTRTRMVIDHANKAIMIQFHGDGIVCEPAFKPILPGITKVSTLMLPQLERPFPSWYRRTQPAEQVAKFELVGAPGIYIFKTCNNLRHEADNYVWDPKTNLPKRGQLDHLVDDVKYLVNSNPMSAPPIHVDPFASWRASDGTSAFHVDKVARELARQRSVASVENLRGMDPCEGGDGDGEPSFIESYGGY